MKKELDEELCSNFPLLYKDRHGDPRSTAMNYGFQCGDGWFEILFDLSAQLEDLIAALPTQTCECWHPSALHKNGKCNNILKNSRFLKPGEELPCSCTGYVPYLPRASTVKEKFGALRFYMTQQTEEMHKLILAAQERSETTCEKCGNEAKIRKAPSGWYACLCNICWKEKKNG